MTSKQLGWLLGGSLLLSLAGCEVTTCKEGDDDCDFDFGDGDSIGDGDGDGDDIDSGMSDAGPKADGGGDGDAGPNGDAGSDASVPTGEPLTLGQFCDEQAKRRLQWADKIEECCAGSPEETSDEAAAILNIFGRDNGANVDCFDKYTPFIANDTIDYVDTKAGACAAAFLAQFSAPPATCPVGGFDSQGIRATVGHGFQLLTQLPACRAAFVGKVARDQPCTDSLQCANGGRCRTAPGGVGSKTCQDPVDSSKTSGTCEAFSDCSDGYLCSGDNKTRVCLPVNDLANDGAKCAFDRECKTNYLCKVAQQGGAGGVCDEPAVGTADDICE